MEKVILEKVNKEAKTVCKELGGEFNIGDFLPAASQNRVYVANLEVAIIIPLHENEIKSKEAVSYLRARIHTRMKEILEKVNLNCKTNL